MSEPASESSTPGRAGGWTDPFRTPERRALRETVRRFVETEVASHLDAWERLGELPRDLHRGAGALGLLGVAFPESIGGGGGDVIDAAVVTEEILYAGGSGGLVASLLTAGIAVPHLAAAGDPAQLDKWVRPTLAGELIGALAVTEPDGGSDVANVRTTAKRDGDHYVVNGAKTFITSGCRADFVVTVVRTGEAGAHGLSLLVVERDTPGFTVTRKLDSCPMWTVGCRRRTWSALSTAGSPSWPPCSWPSGWGWPCRPMPPRSGRST